MNFSGITTCDICNGEGIGVVLWCQGCDIHCPGCHNKETWDFSGGKLFNNYWYDRLFFELRQPYVTRLTLSGGHPLAPENIETILEICKLVKSQDPTKKIWVYTGYQFEDILDYEILKYIDILVDGPFIEDQRDLTLAFRGSRNQRIIDVQESLKQERIVLYEI